MSAVHSGSGLWVGRGAACHCRCHADVASLVSHLSFGQGNEMGTVGAGHAKHGTLKYKYR